MVLVRTMYVCCCRRAGTDLRLGVMPEAFNSSNPAIPGCGEVWTWPEVSIEVYTVGEIIPAPHYQPTIIYTSLTMRSARTAEHALRLANSSSTTTTPSYVCRACRAQAARQFHTSRPVLADEPWHKRMSNYFFGSKESRRADVDREEKNKQRIRELADRGGSTQAEKKVDKFGRELDVAAIVDPSINKQYVQSMTWDGLERIGSEQWVRERADQGEQYVGFLPWKRVQLDAAQWQMLLHHVTVEALTLQKAGRDVEQVCWPRVGSAANWEVTRNARLQASVDGGVTVHFGTPEDESTILASIPTTLPENATQDQETLVNEVTNAVQGDLAEGEDGGIGKLPPAWMDISLHEPTLKMAVSPKRKIP